MIGFWIDTTRDTIPWFTLAGVLVGILAMAATIIRIARNLNQGDK